MRAALIGGIILNLGVLGYYKYADFAIRNLNSIFHTDLPERNLLLPLGLSFYTFKAISMLVDVYTGKVAEINVAYAVTYLSFFGQIQSGPISRYGAFCHNPVLGSTDRLYAGIVRFMIGFSKKVVLADVLYNVTAEVFADGAVLSTPLAWLGAICYSLQLYYDFSGYSDMAIGIGEMFGYECPENFNYPYATKSIAEFWRRWHITLGAWFRDYVYIPLGGSRVAQSRLYVNLLVVWLLTGVWHGAGWNFIFWGLGYFVMIAMEKKWKWPDRCKTVYTKAAYRIACLLMINFQWVMFRSGSLSHGLSFIRTMCTRVGGASQDSRAAFLLRDYGIFIVLAVVFAMPVAVKLEKLCGKSSKSRLIYNSVYILFVGGAFILALSFVVSGQNSPFLYANF